GATEASRMAAKATKKELPEDTLCSGPGSVDAGTACPAAASARPWSMRVFNPKYPMPVPTAISRTVRRPGPCNAWPCARRSRISIITAPPSPPMASTWNIRATTSAATAASSMENEVGATSAPMHHNAPHHSAAIRRTRIRARLGIVCVPRGRRRRSDVTDAEHFVLAHARRRLDFDHVALGLADQGARHRAGHRDQVGFDISFHVADDLVRHAVAGVQVFDVDRGSEHGAAVGVERGGIDDVGIGKRAFEFG